MTLEEYFEFLRQYWEMFGPPPPQPQKNLTRMLNSDSPHF